MFQQPLPSKARIPNRKKLHQHHESKKWTRLPVNEKCLECYPIPRPFLDTAFGKVPPEIRENIFKDVLTVGSLSPLKDGIVRHFSELFFPILSHEMCCRSILPPIPLLEF